MPNENNIEAAADQEKPKKAKKRRKLPGILDPDIRYRGPLNYQHLRIIGWLSFALSVLGMVLSIATMMNSVTGVNTPEVVIELLKGLKDLMMPLFLLANFSLILAARSSYKKIIFFYLAMTLLIIIVFFIYGQRLLNIISKAIGETPEEQRAFRDGIASKFLYGGFNIFLDFLLCSLFAFFLNYQPKKFFQGNKIYIFRAFALLIVAYEVASIVLKILTVQDAIVLPLEFTPFLTAKPIMTFLAFVVIILFIKFRERYYVRHYGTLEDYEKYLETNTNSLHVGAFIGATFFVAAVLDLIILIVMIASLASDPGDEAVFNAIYSKMLRVGIGSAVPLALVTPIAFLFSYTRVPKLKALDKFIPLAGLGVSALIFIEGLFFILGAAV